MFIGLVGVQGAGKTTTFNMLKEVLEGSVIEVMNAKRLKQVCSLVFKFDIEKLEILNYKEEKLDKPIKLTKDNLEWCVQLFNLKYDNKTDKFVGKKLLTRRRVLQFIGTEVLREYNDEIHCQYAYNNAKEGDYKIVTDIRFMNEFEYFKNKDHNFFPIFVDNQRVLEYNFKKANGQLHASEKNVINMKSMCYVLDNNGTLGDLKENVKKLKELICTMD